MITDSGIYIWLFPNGKGYIGQAKNIENRLIEEIKGAFLGGKEYGKNLSDEIRRHGLKPVQMSFFTGDNYGIPSNLFNLFKAAMLTNNGSQLPDLDIAEILYILKAIQSQSGYASLNAQMGGQNSIAQIRQSNGTIIPSLLSRSSSPEEAYNRFAVADVRQANINAFINKFYEAIFSDHWNDYLSYINQQKREIPINNPALFALSWPDFVAQYVLPNISVWSTNSNGMKTIQSQLREWVIDKMTAVCLFLPGYLSQDRKTLNADAKRDFDWASRNIYSSLSNFDGDVSKDIRENLHSIIGSILTAAKYVYTGQYGKGNLARWIANEFFKNINNNKDKITKALQDALINQFKWKLQNNLTKAIRLTNNKLKADSAWWLAFEQWKPSFSFETPEVFFQDQTRTIFAVKIEKALRRRNILNRVEKTMFTSIDENFTTTDSEHGRFYRKESNAIRMNWLDSDDQLYTAVREEYKDTKFYHSWFKFYRPLVSWWRLNKRNYPPFDALTMEHISDGEERGERDWILSKTGQEYYFLYRCARLLNPLLDLEDY